MNYVMKYKETTKLLGHLGLKGHEKSAVTGTQGVGTQELCLCLWIHPGPPAGRGLWKTAQFHCPISSNLLLMLPPAKPNQESQDKRSPMMHPDVLGPWAENRVNKDGKQDIEGQKGYPTCM